MSAARLAISALLILGLSGCGVIGSLGDSLGFGGLRGEPVQRLPYRARLAKGEDRRDVFVRVAGGAATVDAVRESVRYPATTYCLASFGGSDVDWVTDPATGDWAFVREGNEMVFSGRCTAR